jgi:hypothetical protein
MVEAKGTLMDRLQLEKMHLCVCARESESSTSEIMKNAKTESRRGTTGTSALK